MTSPDSITHMAALGLEPTYSAREAAVLLGRSIRGLTSGCGEANSQTRTAVSCSHCERRAGTDAFASRRSGTSHSAATDIGGSRWTR